MPFPTSSVILYRHVVPGAVGTSGAANAEAGKKSRARINLRGGAPSPRRAGCGRALPILCNLCSLRTIMSQKYCTSILILALVFSSGVVGVAADAPKFNRHAVVVVWDGMRPDFVSEETTPTLWKLAHEGVTFRNHHAVYPSATQVNGTAMLTGVYPGRSGVIANYVYRPEIDRTRSISVETPTVVARGDELSGGKYISVPTITDLIHRAGGRTVIAAAKTVGLLLDRQVKVEHASGLPFADNASGTHALPSQAPAKNRVTLFAGQTLPQDVLSPIVAVLGPFPSAHLQRDAWTTKAVTDFLWKDSVPVLSVIWLGEPDLTEHESAPGAPPVLTAIKSSDEKLAAVLA